MEPSLAKKVEISVVISVFTALAIIGIVIVGFAARDFTRAHASLSWPVVEGVVLSADNGGDGRNGTLRYAYSINGYTYESGRERFLSSRLFSSSTADLTPGQTIAVYVDPDDPSAAVLQPGGAGAAFAVIVFAGGVLVFIGVGGVVRTFLTMTQELRAGAAPREPAY